MEKRILFVLIVILLFSINIPAAAANKTVVLPEIMKPQMIAPFGDKLYITEKFNIYIYSLKDFKLIKKFGKEGEGPREFIISPFGPGLIIYPIKDKLIVSSFGKMTYFTPTGEFIEEKKLSGFTVFSPAEHRFVGVGMKANEKNKNVLAVSLYDSGFQPLKDLYISDYEVGPGSVTSLPVSPFYPIPYKKKIYLVAGKEGFVFDVFDLDGKKLKRIQKKYKPQPVTADYKKRMEHWHKHESPTKEFPDLFKISFKSECPALRDAYVIDDRIYAITYKQEQGETECVIMDLEGKEIKRVYIPVPELKPMELPLYGIDSHRFYWLSENIDEEEWELHIRDIR